MWRVSMRGPGSKEALLVPRPNPLDSGRFPGSPPAHLPFDRDSPPRTGHMMAHSTRWANSRAPVVGLRRMAPAAASVKDVTKRVRDGEERRTILHGISFDLARGELVVLRGPSGSGKTTLLAIVGAMLAPTSGEVLLDGEPTSRLRDTHRAQTRRSKVGFVFQDLQLVDGMTARDNVLLPQVPDGVTAETEARADLLLDRFGVRTVAECARAVALRRRTAAGRARPRPPIEPGAPPPRRTDGAPRRSPRASHRRGARGARARSARSARGARRDARRTDRGARSGDARARSCRRSPRRARCR